MHVEYSAVDKIFYFLYTDIKFSVIANQHAKAIKHVDDANYIVRLAIA